MSEQNSSNLQAFGAGVVGFFVVVAVGGGALVYHSSLQTKRPSAAGAPIDIASPSGLAPAERRLAAKEARAESPAPVIGDVAGEEPSPAAAHSQQAAAAAPAAPRAGIPLPSTPRTLTAAEAVKVQPALEATKHLGTDGGSTSAELVAQAPAKDARVPLKKSPKGSRKLELPSNPNPGPTDVASVHYGVTSRSELMGRAAGPVYNFKGGAAGGGAGVGKLAGDASATVADLKAQLAKGDLPAADRERIQGELDKVEKAVDSTAGR